VGRSPNSNPFFFYRLATAACTRMPASRLKPNRAPV
jgi:hypothetical protein